MKILLLGVGMQGRAALHDLIESREVTEVIATDLNFTALKDYTDSRYHQYKSKLHCEHFDATIPESIENLLQHKPDVIIDLMPVAMHNAVSIAAVHHGIHLVNASYVTSEMIRLSTEAKAKNITILPEFGMDPGIDLVLLGQAVKGFDSIEKIITYGAGFPEHSAADNPLKYKVTWNLEGVLKSYFRPAIIINKGDITEIKKDELFNPGNTHEIDIEGLGILEAFPNGNSSEIINMLDINSTELHTAGRYVLRWPGHCAFWKKLVALGLLSDEPVEIDGRPIDKKRFLASLLAPHLHYEDNERDVVVVRVEVTGKKKGKRQRSVYQLIDHRDLDIGFTAMSRTVGYTAAIGARMIGAGNISKRGILSPINDIPFETFKSELANKAIHITSQITPLNNREIE